MPQINDIVEVFGNSRAEEEGMSIRQIANAIILIKTELMLSKYATQIT
jgi:hypothetical protein